MAKYWRSPFTGTAKSPIDAALTRLSIGGAYSGLAENTFFDSVTSLVALCLDSSGDIVFKLSALPSDRKLYLNSGVVYARLTNQVGDRLLTLNSGEISAT